MDAALALPVLIALIAVALAFDFLNGLHDAANSIATIVSTRVLRPQFAVAWAAFFNFIAFLFFGLHVAQTVGTGIVAADVVDPRVIFAALVGAISWNIDHLVFRHSVELLACFDRRPGRRRARQGGIELDRVGRIAEDQRRDRAVAAHRLRAGADPHPAGGLAVRAHRRPTASIASSARCNSSPPRSIRSAMAATMRRRPWASSRCCCSRRAISAANSMCRSGW